MFRSIYQAVENVAAEVVQQAVSSANGDAVATEEGAAATEGANGEVAATPQKKKNPIRWVQKKISIKKVKTPKKAPAAEEAVAEATEEAPTEATPAEAEKVSCLSWPLIMKL